MGCFNQGSSDAKLGGFASARKWELVNKGSRAPPAQQRSPFIPQWNLRHLAEMDLKTAVFNAARDGKLRLLQKLLENKDGHEVTKLMGEKTNGATPLLMASRYGHLDLVEYLLECCSAPIEVGGSVNFDGETIEGAPPLWAASAAGHLKVVQSLLGHGASVNSTTLTNSTPLRAACFDGHLDIVKYLVEHKADLEVANRHGHTCLMISCYKGHKDIAQYLLQNGADVNRKSVKGEWIYKEPVAIRIVVMICWLLEMVW